MLTGVHPLGAAARPTARAYSQPDLSPLEPADRAVLAAALDRTASRRFGSCMELIAALEQRGEKAAAPAARRRPRSTRPPAADPRGSRRRRGRRLAAAQARPVPLPAPARRAPAPRMRRPRLRESAPRCWRTSAAVGRPSWRKARDDALVYRAARIDEQPARAADKSAGWEIALRFHPHADSLLADVRIEARPLGCGPVRAKQLLDEAGPALLDALRTALQAHPDRRRQDRVPFDQPVDSAHRRGGRGAGDRDPRPRRDLSRTGMGLWLPVKPATRRVVIYSSPGGDAPPAPVPVAPGPPPTPRRTATRPGPSSWRGGLSTR